MITIRFLAMLVCLSVSACALSNGPETECQTCSKIEFTADYIQFLKHLNIDQKYQDEFQQIEIVSDQISQNMDDGELSGACRAADICIALCRHLTGRYYRETIQPMARRIEEESGAYREYGSTEASELKLSSLGEIQREPLLKAQDDTFSVISQVIRDIDMLLKTSSDLRSSFTETFLVDDLFQKQTCELSGGGKRLLRDLVEKAVAVASREPSRIVEIRFKSIGYTDQLDFGKDSPLLQTILDRIDETPPEKGGERRRFLNRRLSFLRAQAVAEYIDFMGLKIKSERKGRFSIITEASGRGEDPPPDLEPPYPVPDQRRRICRVHVFYARH